MLLVRFGNASSILRHARAVQIGHQLPRVFENGTVSWTPIITKELVMTTGGLYTPLTNAEGQPGDAIVNSDGILVPIYGNEAYGNALYNPAQSRKLFKSWLSQWSDVINNVPCIGAIAPNGTDSFIVALMRKFAQFHHPSTIEADELDANQFICYIATHTAEFETELEMIADYCPELLNTSSSFEQVIFSWPLFQRIHLN